MIGAADFPIFRFPAVPDDAMLCVGLRIDEEDEWLRAAHPFVNADEQAQAQRFHHRIDAARHLVGRALVRRVLGARPDHSPLGPFARTFWGKPHAPRQAIDFSITHSGRMVCAAFCRKAAIGIDVEEVRPLPDVADLARQLGPAECRAILALPAGERLAAFLRCWTRKEALLKAAGTGLGQPLADIQVSTEPHETGWIIVPPREGMADGTLGPPPPVLSWSCRDLSLGEAYHGAVAANRPHLALEQCLA